MTPKLEKPLRREVEVQGEPYIVTLSPAGVRLIRKGTRRGAQEMTWLELVSGEAQLHRDLVRSLAHRQPPHQVIPPNAERRRRPRRPETV